MSCLQACLISFPFLAIVERGGVKGAFSGGGAVFVNVCSVASPKTKLKTNKKKT